MKTVIVHRFGAIGDFIIITPLLRALKEDGYHVTLNCNKRGMEILRGNPNIDAFREHDTSKEPGKELDEYLAKVDKDYDKVVNLCESIEGSLARVPWRKDFHVSADQRHKECNKNFYDYALAWGGYSEITGKNGELYFSRLEERLAKDVRKKHKDKFLILWSLSGSSPHKVYAFTEDVIQTLTRAYGDVVVMTVGDEVCELIEPRGAGIKNYSGKWPIRKSLLMTKYVDLVVGTDTGLMHGAGCFDTPKILLLSSNTEENLSKHWKNCVSLEPPVECHPCHQMHYSREHCILDRESRTPICMTKLDGETVLGAINNVYANWVMRKTANG